MFSTLTNRIRPHLTVFILSGVERTKVCLHRSERLNIDLEGGSSRAGPGAVIKLGAPGHPALRLG